MSLIEDAMFNEFKKEVKIVLMVARNHFMGD